MPCRQHAAADGRTDERKIKIRKIVAWLKFHDLTFVVSRESERVVALLPCQGCLALNTPHKTWEREGTGLWSGRKVETTTAQHIT